MNSFFEHLAKKRSGPNTLVLGVDSSGLHVVTF